ncbi:MAG: PIN domain-containing protein [archaeon]|nr:PIN domain-containing protein [archaeon]
MSFITDTHAFIWHLTQDPRLGKKAVEIFDKSERGEIIVIIPTIVLAECLYLAEKYKIALKFTRIVKKIRIATNYMTYPLSLDVVIEAQKLKKLREIHDRIIVATAKLMDASLITKDKSIQESRYVEVIW